MWPRSCASPSEISMAALAMPRNCNPWRYRFRALQSALNPSGVFMRHGRFAIRYCQRQPGIARRSGDIKRIARWFRSIPTQRPPRRDETHRLNRNDRGGAVGGVTANQLHLIPIRQRKQSSAKLRQPVLIPPWARSAPGSPKPEPRPSPRTLRLTANALCPMPPGRHGQKSTVDVFRYSTVTITAVDPAAELTKPHRRRYPALRRDDAGAGR